MTIEPAAGAEKYLALDFANSAVAQPGGQFIDLLGTPSATNRWLTERGLAPAEAGIQEMCAAQLRSMREHIRSLLAARVAGIPALPAALSAVNDALSRVPTAALLHWDEKNGPYRAAACPPNEILDRALAALATNAADLLTGPDADSLTTCDSPPCSRYLLRHGRRQWCSTRCGDRVRAARAYARRTKLNAD
ncbi:putative RNA-binding Zn ribbon-like protein [Kibdelosporangium banguiense]|uniref:RNA-binding Zn ribbon-like protein n=1 Tax=Kibdelosporangium banguiense TaxID=1365924 RepID=A0ABS4U1G2_9PSEU|nr:ABATE domain-containing protein [Kibdelosporangium banguiense]MBP2330492.1 putative RNA-binding Zn ribbon-like protein [Kibdelosporangium banguiense]